MPKASPFRIQILDITLLTFAAALLLGPWGEMERAESGPEWNRAAALFFNALLASGMISGAILARCSGNRRDEEWLSGAFGTLLVNQGVATAMPDLAVVLMPIGVVIAGGLLFYVLGHVEF
ncbi:hypothetical protein [Tautonia plasticadhaerens]|uniref:Uncharacterized protein n=1 Tax=Tautonia plasticadhaerens TaxID=2527974 RepID=A0A518GXA7_9BACT|nr:hypothetical protein [Tautonia plasticadhaerens]QDV33234.1 hypothetical protein ElP_10760 [Tautonia plasticadhaerens]